MKATNAWREDREEWRGELKMCCERERVLEQEKRKKKAADKKGVVARVIGAEMETIPEMLLEEDDVEER